MLNGSKVSSNPAIDFNLQPAYPSSSHLDIPAIVSGCFSIAIHCSPFLWLKIFHITLWFLWLDIFSLEKHRNIQLPNCSMIPKNRNIQLSNCFWISLKSRTSLSPAPRCTALPRDWPCPWCGTTRHRRGLCGTSSGHPAADGVVSWCLRMQLHLCHNHRKTIGKP